MERSIEAKTIWKLVKSKINSKNQTVTSRVNFHLAKLKKLFLRSFNSKISASCQWISVTHGGSYKLDKSVLSSASRIVYYNIAVTWYNKKSESPKVTSTTIMRTRETCKLFCSLKKQPTFRNATTHSVFPAKCRLSNERRNFMLVTCHHPDLESASHWLNQIPSRDDRPEALLRSGEWKVISMEFLRSFLRRSIARKLVTESGGVVKWVLFLRLQFSTHESNLSCNKSGCYRLRKVIVELCNKICI